MFEYTNPFNRKADKCNINIECILVHVNIWMFNWWTICDDRSLQTKTDSERNTLCFPPRCCRGDTEIDTNKIDSSKKRKKKKKLFLKTKKNELGYTTSVSKLIAIRRNIRAVVGAKNQKNHGNSERYNLEEMCFPTVEKHASLWNSVVHPKSKIIIHI